MSLVIPSRSRSCHGGKEPFKPEMDYYSLLLAGDKGFTRQDFCDSCWNQIHKTLDMEERIYWRSQVPPKQEKPDPSLSRSEKALWLLKKNINKGEETEQEAFILALLLARSRTLQLKQEIQDHQLYEVVGTEEMIPVKKIALSELRLKEVQELLAKRLGNE